ncbi:F-box and WD-40 domain protein 7 [Brevipalpus obovatus]|uniref:F-box and WD-40 domain protein 7 n=1 Tax=Brevipalpus obovatus TaxID=246614 RepID=UPI003D9E5B4E
MWGHKKRKLGCDGVGGGDETSEVKSFDISTSSSSSVILEDPDEPFCDAACASTEDKANIDHDDTDCSDPASLALAHNDTPSSLSTETHSLGERTPSKLIEWLTTFHLWSHKERLIAFDSLISSDICDLQQIRHLYSLIKPQFQRDFISLLPRELSLHVLAYLGPKDLLRAAQACRTWRVLCEDNLLWREKCEEEGIFVHRGNSSDFYKSQNRYCDSLSPVPSPSSSPSSSSIINSTDCPSSSSATPFVRSEFKINYIRQKILEFNWRYGRFSPDIAEEPKGKSRLLKEILHLKGHDDHVITCLRFNPESNIIVSGSDDCTLRVWSATTGRCLRTLTGHTGGVWSSQLSPSNILISGSTDRTLRVWNAMTGECHHVLFGHTSTVRCMALHGDKVVSGSRDATLRVWDINTGECCHVLPGHQAAVRCVQYNGKIAVSGAYDNAVRVWDVEKELCMYVLEGHVNRVYSLQFDGETIVSGSLDTFIFVWSARTGKLKHKLVGHQSLTSGLQLRGNILVSGNADSTVKVWDINTGECLQTLAGENKHTSAVTCLQFNSKFVITSSDDGTVKLWDVKTGEFVRNLVSLPSKGQGGVVWRIRASDTKLVCAVGSRNGTEETKLLVLDFDPDAAPTSDKVVNNSLHPPSPLELLCQNQSELSTNSSNHAHNMDSSVVPSIGSGKLGYPSSSTFI